MHPLSQNIMNKIVHETALYKALGSATKSAVCKKVDIRRVSTQRRPARDWRIVHMRATTGGKEAAKELHYSETSAYMYICTHMYIHRGNIYFLKLGIFLSLGIFLILGHFFEFG